MNQSIPGSPLPLPVPYPVLLFLYNNLPDNKIPDYYTEKEALDKALEVAKEIQSTFESWDSFVQSYLEGYEAGSGDTSGDREEIYENLKACQWNPYSVNWNTKLKKNW